MKNLRGLVWLSLGLGPLGGCLLVPGCASAKTAGEYRVKSGTIGTSFTIDVQTGGFKIGIGFPGHIDIEGEGKYSAGKVATEGDNGTTAPSFDAFGTSPVPANGG